MPFPGRHLKLTYGGKSTKDDQWSNSLSLLDNSGDGGDQGRFGGNVNLEDIYNAIRAQYASNNFGMEPFCTLDYVKIAQIGADGRYIGDARTFTSPSPAVGATNFDRAPQDSLVITLDSGSRSGLARKGRIYLPAGFVQIDDTTGRVAVSHAAQAADKIATIIGYLEQLDVNGSKVDVIIASSQGAGAFKKVTSVSAGDVLDTQRRRRNRVSEKYVGKQTVSS